jgi:TPR repeat protein
LLRNKEEAAEWLRKGLELRDAAPDDPRVTGPINPYAVQPTTPDLRAQLRTAVVYINQVVDGSNPETVAKSIGMTSDELEIAHVAYFFLPETFAEVMGMCFGSTGQIDENRARSAVPLIPRPAGMDDGVLSQKTVELSVRISLELERIQQQVREREVTLSEAFRCFEMGHKLDPMNPELLYWLADSYYWGCGVQDQKETAVALYRRAADQGHSNSQYCVGVLCSDGEAVAQDEAEAAVWFRKAAEQGNTDAMVSLGLAYKNGRGVPQDYAQGAMWLRRAGEKDSFGDPI